MVVLAEVVGQGLARVDAVGHAFVLGVEAQLHLFVFARGAPIVLLAHVQVERAVAVERLVDAGFDFAALGEGVEFVRLLQTHRFIKVAIAFGGIAIPGEAYRGASLEGLAVTHAKTLAFLFTGRDAGPARHIGLGLGHVQRHGAQTAQAFAHAHNARAIEISAQQATI
ncbi:hypothetical protein D3C81_1695480 [compost metagenome]